MNLPKLCKQLSENGIERIRFCTYYSDDSLENLPPEFLDKDNNLIQEFIQTTDPVSGKRISVANPILDKINLDSFLDDLFDTFVLSQALGDSGVFELDTATMTLTKVESACITDPELYTEPVLNVSRTWDTELEDWGNFWLPGCVDKNAPYFYYRSDLGYLFETTDMRMQNLCIHPIEAIVAAISGSKFFPKSSEIHYTVINNKKDILAEVYADSKVSTTYYTFPLYLEAFVDGFWGDVSEKFSNFLEANQALKDYTAKNPEHKIRLSDSRGKILWLSPKLTGINLPPAINNSSNDFVELSEAQLIEILKKPEKVEYKFYVKKV